MKTGTTIHALPRRMRVACAAFAAACALGLAAVLAAGAQAATTIDGIPYTLNADGTASVAYVKATTSKLSGSKVIPQTVVSDDGTTYTVTGLDNKAFYGATNVTSISLPSTVTTFGTSAFSGCTQLAQVNIPDGVTAIPDSCFNNCKALKNFTIPAQVTSIGKSAFSGCAAAFTTLNIPATVASVGDSAFKGCSAISELTVSSQATTLGAHVFQNCTGLDSAKVTLPAGMTSIPDYMFSGCSKIADLSFMPSTITQIGRNAFEATGLTNVNLSDSITKIGTNLFDNCASLVSVKLPDNESVKAQYQTDTATADLGTGFSGCTKLSSVTFPDGITYLPTSCFQNCTAITSLAAMPATVTKIGAFAFSGSALTGALKLPAAVIEIGNSAFYNTVITSATVSDAVTTMGTSVFQKCAQLQSAKLPAALTDIPASTFDGCTALATLDISDQITSIGKCAFQGCAAITSFIIPETCTSLDSGCFKGIGLTEVTVPASVTNFNKTDAKNGVFQDCTSLKTATFVEGCTQIPYNMFNGCTALDTVNMPSTLKTVGSSSGSPFTGCTSLKTLDYPEGVTYLSSHAALSVESVTVPSTVESLPSRLFANCHNLTTAIIKTSAELPQQLFNGSENLSSVTLAEGPKSIPAKAFMGTTALKELIIPSTVESIDAAAFTNSGIEKYIFAGVRPATLPDEITDANSYFYVNFLNPDGTSIDAQVLSAGQTATEPAAPEYDAEGKKFVGWSIEDWKQAIFDSGYRVTALYAAIALTVNKKEGDRAVEKVAEYTIADLQKLVDPNAQAVSALYARTGGSWSVDSSQNYVTLSTLFGDADIDAYYTQDATVSYAAADGFGSEGVSYSALEKGKFYPDTTKDSTTTTTNPVDAPAALALTEASSAIADGATAAETQTANLAAAAATNAPRMIYGVSAEEYAAGNAPGKRLVSNVATITLAYPEPTIFELNVQRGSHEPTLVKAFTKSELEALATKGTPMSGMYFPNGVWNVASSDNYVTMTNLFADAGLARDWTCGAAITYGSKGDAPQQSVSYDTLYNEQNLFFPAAHGANSDAPDNAMQVEPILTLTEYSSPTVDASWDRTALEAQTYNIQMATTDTTPRILYGISKDMYANPSTAKGIRYWSTNSYITLTLPGFDEAVVGDIPAQKVGAKPEPVVKIGGKTLEKDVDYTLSWSGIDKAGTGTVTITPIGDYEGDAVKRASFTVEGSSSSDIWKRLSGGTAIGTMKAIVNEGWSSSDWAIVATTNGYYDALSASGLAGLLDCPILMTSPTSLTDATSALIKSRKVKNVIVVGGLSAVSDNVFNQIKKLGVSVERVAGGTAIGTANKIYEYGKRVNGGWGKDAIVATSSSYQDALSIAPFAYAKKAPIFLTKGKSGTLADTTAKAIKSGGFTRTIITGGEAAVAKSVESQVTKSWKRLWGNTAYGTSRKIADFCIKEGDMTAAHMGVATGKSYYDALAGAALCGKMNSVLVLADDGNNKNVDNVVKVYKNKLEKSCYIFGGTSAVSANVENKIKVASK